MNQNACSNTSQHNHSVPKAEQTPRSFVRDQAVSSRERGSVKGEKSHEARVGIRQAFARESGASANDRQHQDQGFTPHRTIRRMKKEQPVKIEMPGMNVRGFSTSSMKPWLVSFDRVEQSTWVFEKR